MAVLLVGVVKMKNLVFFICDCINFNVFFSVRSIGYIPNLIPKYIPATEIYYLILKI